MRGCFFHKSMEHVIAVVITYWLDNYLTKYEQKKTSWYVSQFSITITNIWDKSIYKDKRNILEISVHDPLLFSLWIGNTAWQGACRRTKLLTSWEMKERKRKRLGPHNPLPHQGMCPGTRRHPTNPHFLKAPLPPISSTLRSQPWPHGPCRNTEDPNYSRHIFF